jgi:hypothetical protein
MCSLARSGALVKRWKGTEKTILAFFKKLPAPLSLKKFHLTLAPRRDGSVRVGLLEGAILNILASRGIAPSLKALTLQDMTDTPKSRYHSLGMRSFLSNLTELTISTTRVTKYEPVYNAGNPRPICSANTVPLHFLAPAQSNLTCLTLCCQRPNAITTHIDLDPINFPHLKSLSFCRVYFGGNTTVENFILRHAATMVHLTLHGCMMRVGFHAAGLPMSPSWCDVYTKFERVLTRLEIFSLYPLQSHAMLACGDVSPRLNYMDYLGLYPFPRVFGRAVRTADEEARKSLLRSIEERGNGGSDQFPTILGGSPG